MSDVEVLEFMQAVQRQKSVLDGQMVRAVARLHALRETMVSAKYVSDELAAALSWSTRAASHLVYTAVDLADRLPQTVAALEAGQLDMPKAKAILEWTAPLEDEPAQQVAAGVVAWSVGRTVSAVRQKLAREVLKVDPAAAEARRRERIERRSVEVVPQDDGMATLAVYDQADRIRALFELLDYLARKARAGGDPRTLDALRTDLLYELLMGGQRPKVELRVTVPASVLAGVSEDPGWLHGYGPITRDAVWELAAQSEFWRRIITDPATGTVMEVSRRQPPGSLREFINTRTPTCLAIGCGRPAEACETDHTHDYAAGGPTAEGNLGPACRRHNLMKLDGGWRLEQPEPGRFVWTTPAGLRYAVEPEPVTQPTPDPAPVVVDSPPPF
jgi:hypothetical protein